MNKEAIINYAGIEFILNGVFTENEESYCFQSEIITVSDSTINISEALPETMIKKMELIAIEEILEQINEY